jgi:hypothetical protein
MALRNLAGLALAASLLGATAANATTKNFEYDDAAMNPVATGSFSYADGATGVLGYADLTAFSVTINYSGDTYNLSDIPGFTDYQYFGYDTAANVFVTSGSLCGFAGCGFTGSLAAISPSANAGFFFDQAPGQFADYANFQPTEFSSISISSGAPEPAGWAMMLLGFGGLGAMLRSRRRAALATA